MGKSIKMLKYMIIILNITFLVYGENVCGLTSLSFV